MQTYSFFCRLVTEKTFINIIIPKPETESVGLHVIVVLLITYGMHNLFFSPSAIVRHKTPRPKTIDTYLPT